MLQRALSVFTVLVVTAACQPLPPQRAADAPPVQVSPGHTTLLPAMQQPEIVSGPPLKVALLVPVSGRAEKVGKALQDAVLALFDKYAAMNNLSHARRVELLPKNTQGTPEGAIAAAVEAEKEGAEMIIGPLFAASAEAIKRKVSVPVLSFSNDDRIAGGHVYAFGFRPSEQAARSAAYAFQIGGVTRMALLVPADDYGNKVAEAVEAEAKKTGATITAIVRFSAVSGVMKTDIEELTGNAPDPNFNGLFLAAGGEQLSRMMPLLTEANITPQRVQFVGTGLWDEPKLLQRNRLDGAIFASAPPEDYANFATRFSATYDYAPPRIASLAYDAVALATSLAMTAPGFSDAALMNPNGYYGPANGVFRILGDKTTQRQLAVIQATGRDVKVVDTAPRSFATP
jgi:ABC-type branched-subunit amino acid transport system substrate-binding protein